MKPKGFAWLLVLLCVISVTVCAPKKARIETTPLFWEVTSGDSTLYLLGSIHVAVPEIYPLDAVIMDAYKASSTVVFESDFTSERVETVGGSGGAFPDRGPGAV